MVYRVGICRILHESNGFVSRETTLDDFRQYGGLRLGSELLEQPERRDEVTGFLDVLRSAGENIETVPLLSTGGFASGYLSPETVRSLSDALHKSLGRAGKLDGILFALHGAMASSAIPDLDGYFLEIVREEVGPQIPVVCSLDLHAVVTRQMVELATAFTVYRTHPHTDVVETGARAAEILLQILTGRIDPVLAWRRVPMMFPPPDEGTTAGPLKELVEALAAAESRPGVVSCSHGAGYPWQDVPEQGWSVLTLTNGDQPLAEQLARQLAAQAWDARQALLPARMLPPWEAVRAAAKRPGHPIVIVDSADTVGGGSPGDTTELLAALLELRAEVDGLALASLPDPEAVAVAVRAGAGADVELSVGGKRDARLSRPLQVRGKVLRITDGIIEDLGKFGATPFIDAGTMAAIAVDNVRIVLTERVVDGPQPSLFRKVDIEPFAAKVVALKTGVGYKATYSAVARGVVRADCPGGTAYNLCNYEYQQARRPLYPLEPGMEWVQG